MAQNVPCFNTRLVKADELVGYASVENDGSETSFLVENDDPHKISVEEFNYANEKGEREVIPLEEMVEFRKLMSSLPRSSVTDDIQVLKQIDELATKFTVVRIFLGDCQEAFYTIFNSTSLEKSRGDVSLQDILLQLVDVITRRRKMARKVIQNYDYITPFLVGCLSSKSIENRNYAAYLVRELAELDSGFSREIGKAGAVTSLIHNIGEDQVLKPITAMLELCLELENREFAVSNGVTTAVMKMVVSRVHVKATLQALKMLSKHEEAIAEMEGFGILKYLFEILGEDVGDQVKGYCVDIIHAMCHASSAINTRMQIKDVENARQKLERLVNTKLNEVLLKLQEWDNEESS